MSESEPPTPGPNMPEPRDAERGEPADLDSEHGEPAGFDAERNEPAGFDAERRRTLQTLAVVLNALAAALVAIPVLGYLLAPLVRRRRDAWIDLGGVEVFPMNQTRLTTYRNPHTIPWDGQSENVACYVHRSSAEKFSIFAVNCTHLGCPVDWFPESGLFLCPCHGGAYYSDGQRASGPPPRGLYEYDYRVEKGRLLVLGGHLPTLQNTMKSQA